MADGAAPSTMDAAKGTELVRRRIYNAETISYAYASGERTRPFAGNINVAARKERFALAPYRVAKFGFVAVPGGGYLTVRQGDVSLFNVGFGGAYTAVNGGMTGMATDAESMAGPQGAIVRNGATFVAVGLEIQRAGAWYTPEASAADQLGNRDWTDWVSDNGPEGFAYTTELQKLIEPAAFFRYQLFPNTLVQEQRCGSLSEWMARAPRVNTPGNFTAFTSEYGSGGQKTSSQLQCFISLGGDPARILRVQERTGLALPADGALVLEYSMMLWGYTICGDPADDDACAMPGASAQSLGQIRQYITELRQMLAAGEIDRQMFSDMLRDARAAMPALTAGG